MVDEDILVIGAGIAGLCAALALGGRGRVTVIERDGPPPEGDANAAFAEWKRRGVGHLRHSHAFLARLRNLIRDEHPRLLEDLLAAGCREITFADMMPPEVRHRYAPKPEDADLTILTSRRTTLELVIRRYVETLPGVTLRPGVFVRSLLTERDEAGRLTVRGVEADGPDGPETIRASVTVDAGGRLSNGPEQLIAEGARITETSETAGILYYTRHYRLLDGQVEPPRDKPASGDLGYLKFGVFPADNGRFSITVAIPEIETELRRQIMKPELFDGICGRLPGLQPWVDPARSEPLGQVYGMGDLHSRWRDFAPNGEPAVLGYFAVGDALARTNPLYGRGCSFAAVAAFMLKDVLAKSDDPLERGRAYAVEAEQRLRPYYENMLQQDRTAIRRAENALTPGYKPKLKAKLTQSFVEDGITIATRSDPVLLREAMRGFHMLEHPSDWLKRPKNMVKVMGYWARGKRANAAAYPPKPGPERDVMFADLGIDASVDRLPAAA